VLCILGYGICAAPAQESKAGEDVWTEREAAAKGEAAMSTTLGVMTSEFDRCWVEPGSERPNGAAGASGGTQLVHLATPGETAVASQRHSHGFVTLGELERICRAQPSNHIVEGLIPADDVHVAVGDSGLGKTPWAYQLGLCVASGKMFLGHAVKQGRVLYYDLENGREEILEVSRSLCGYLGISSFPPEFHVLRDEGNPVPLRDAAEEHSPLLVIVDTLRAFRPGAESKNEEMASFLGECKRVARQYHCAILLLHHIRKPGENAVPLLETSPVLEWLLQASGARALINQTNTRIAFDVPRGGLSQASDAALVVKSFVKMRGESGPFYLARVLDGDGEPVGYRRIVGCQLLGNQEQEEAFRRLPDAPKQFTFKEARYAYGKTDNPTRQWLKKCEAAGLIRQAGRGTYEKLAAIATPESGEVAEGSTEVSRPVGDNPSVLSEEGLKNAV